MLSATSDGISIASFATDPLWIASASLIFAFSLTTGITKVPLKTTWNKSKKHNETVIITRSKVNSIESKISEALINNKISHENFTTIINEDRNYRKLKESITMMKSQRNDTEKNRLIKDDKRIGTDKRIITELIII